MKRLTEYTIPETGFSVVSEEKYKRIMMEEKPSVEKVYNRLKKIEDILGDEYDLDELKEMVQAKREERCVVLNMPRKPLVWGDDDQNTCLCPYCGKDLMGIPYGERMVLQCPECGQYLDATKVITRAEAEAALRREQDG